jgi:hypothetical protein
MTSWKDQSDHGFPTAEMKPRREGCSDYGYRNTGYNHHWSPPGNQQAVSVHQLHCTPSHRRAAVLCCWLVRDSAHLLAECDEE